MQVGLSAGASARLAGDPEAQRALEGELGRLFGSPAGVRYLMLEAWEAVDFDPNRPGLGRTPELLLEAARADNEQRFRQELSSVEEGQVPSGRRALSAVVGAWSRAGGDDLAALAEGIRDYHPTLTQSAQLYQRLCVTCHGREGGGNGPGSRAMNPPPRDFRSGEFVHYRAEERQRPDPSELVAVLYNGVSGTSMSPFKRHSTAELSGLADFVRWLSLRGRVESRLAPLFADGARPTPAESERIYAEEFVAWGAPVAEPKDSSADTEDTE